MRALQFSVFQTGTDTLGTKVTKDGKTLIDHDTIPFSIIRLAGLLIPPLGRIVPKTLKGIAAELVIHDLENHALFGNAGTTLITEVLPTIMAQIVNNALFSSTIRYPLNAAEYAAFSFDFSGEDKGSEHFGKKNPTILSLFYFIRQALPIHGQVAETVEQAMLKFTEENPEAWAAYLEFYKLTHENLRQALEQQQFIDTLNQTILDAIQANSQIPKWIRRIYPERIEGLYAKERPIDRVLLGVDGLHLILQYFTSALACTAVQGSHIINHGQAMPPIGVMRTYEMIGIAINNLYSRTSN
jgi:hypothetical protein